MCTLSGVDTIILTGHLQSRGIVSGMSYSIYSTWTADTVGACGVTEVLGGTGVVVVGTLHEATGGGQRFPQSHAWLRHCVCEKHERDHWYNNVILALSHNSDSNTVMHGTAH